MYFLTKICRCTRFKRKQSTEANVMVSTNPIITHNGTSYQHTTADVFEPRTDIIEKLVTELKDMVRQNTTNLSAQKKIQQQLEQIIELNVDLTSTIHDLQKAICQSKSTSSIISRPTIIPPNDIKYTSTPPINIPNTCNYGTKPLSPTWFPVSIKDKEHENTNSFSDDDT